MKSFLLLIMFACFLPADVDDLQDMAGGLAHDEFDQREKALDKMRKAMANPARRTEFLAEIRKLWIVEKNPEIRARLSRLGEELFVGAKGALFGFRFTLHKPVWIEGRKTTSVVVSEVVEGSPAQRAGLKADDVIYGVNETLLDPNLMLNEIADFFRRHSPTKAQVLRIRRGDEDLKIPVKPDPQELTPDDRIFLGKKYHQWLLQDQPNS